MREMEIIKNCKICGVDLRYLTMPIHRKDDEWYCDICWKKIQDNPIRL